MLAAFTRRDPSYDGVFVTAVSTTGIFCRPTCPARRPRPEHVEFFRSPREALLAGFRPCRRCRPMEPDGTPPPWLAPLLAEVESDPSRRWRDADLRARGLSPGRVRRWFHTHHALTFQAYSRARRLAAALGQIQSGSEVTEAAFASGYDSLSGFNEAFRRLLGNSPTAVKDAPLLTIARIPSALGPMVAAADERALLLLEFADRRMLETQLATLRRRLGCGFAPGTNGVIERVTREARRVLRRTAPELRDAARHTRHRIPAGGVATARGASRTARRSPTPRSRARSRPSRRGARGGEGGRRQPHRHSGSLPSRGRANGDLTGYGGGLWRKKRLLEIEGRSGGAVLSASTCRRGMLS